MTKTRGKLLTKVLPFDIDQILLNTREVFLFGNIDEGKAEQVVKELLALSHVSDNPIALWVNSSGGSVYDGFAIIDVMKGLSCPVYTITCGQAMSMASLIAMAGDKRFVTEDSLFLLHDMMTSLDFDSTKKLLRRAEDVKKEHERFYDFLKAHGTFSRKEIEIIQQGELLLHPDECLEHNIVDEIIKSRKPRKQHDNPKSRNSKTN